MNSENYDRRVMTFYDVGAELGGVIETSVIALMFLLVLPQSFSFNTFVSSKVFY